MLNTDRHNKAARRIRKLREKRMKQIECVAGRIQLCLSIITTILAI